MPSILNPTYLLSNFESYLLQIWSFTYIMVLLIHPLRNIALETTIQLFFSNVPLQPNLKTINVSQNPSNLKHSKSWSFVCLNFSRLIINIVWACSIPKLNRFEKEESTWKFEEKTSHVKMTWNQSHWRYIHYIASTTFIPQTCRKQLLIASL